jgi:hypothetical protein
MANAVILDPPVTDWYCPACKATAQTREHTPHTRFHPCPKLKYASVPMVQKGIAAGLRLNVREDYLNQEDQATTLDGDPVMSISIVREDGEDCFAYAPSARRSRADYD